MVIATLQTEWTISSMSTFAACGRAGRRLDAVTSSRLNHRFLPVYGVNCQRKTG